MTILQTDEILRNELKIALSKLDLLLEMDVLDGPASVTMHEIREALIQATTQLNPTPPPPRKNLHKYAVLCKKAIYYYETVVVDAKSADDALDVANGMMNEDLVDFTAIDDVEMEALEAQLVVHKDADEPDYWQLGYDDAQACYERNDFRLEPPPGRLGELECLPHRRVQAEEQYRSGWRTLVEAVGKYDG